MKKLSVQQKIDNLIVTQGSEGAVMYNKKNNKWSNGDIFFSFNYNTSIKHNVY